MRRHDQVNPSGSGHLCQTLDRRLDFLTRDHHQIRHFVDNDDDQRQFAGIERLRFENRLPRFGIEPCLDLPDHAFTLGLGIGQTGVEPVDIADSEL